MFVAFMPLHILLCDEVLQYFILRIEVIWNLKFELKSNKFVSYKMFWFLAAQLI
jgi:hypothetical protein